MSRQAEYIDRNYDRTVAMLTSINMQVIPEEALANDDVAWNLASEVAGEVDKDIIRALASGDVMQALSLLQIAYTKALRREAEIRALKETQVVLVESFEELSA